MVCKSGITHSTGSFVQSIGDFPCSINSLLHCENCLHPKNPRWADSGEG